MSCRIYSPPSHPPNKGQFYITSSHTSTLEWKVPEVQISSCFLKGAHEIFGNLQNQHKFSIYEVRFLHEFRNFASETQSLPLLTERNQV